MEQRVPQDRRRSPRLTGVVIANGFGLGMLALWWVYAQFVPPYILPGPFVVLERMVEFITVPVQAKQIAVSIGHVFTSIAIAFVSGCVLAALSVNVEMLRLFIDNRLTPFVNAFSAIGWLFIGILWFGLNSTTVIFAVTMILLPFTVINIRTGLQEIDRDLLELGRSLNRNRLRNLRKLVLPLLLPYIFTALRISFGVSWKVVLTAELFGGNAGVGYVLNVARQEFDTETIFAIIVFILILVILSELLVFRPLQRALDRRLRRD